MFVKKCTVGRDCEKKYTQKGDAICNVSLAYNYGRKGEDGKYPTQWIEATLFGKKAENTAQYLLKGTQIVAVVKDLHIETYPKKDGSGDGFKLTGFLDDFEFCGVKSINSEEKPVEKYAGGLRNDAPKAKATSMDDFESNIPF
jgi:single-strand DNA-binding protein